MAKHETRRRASPVIVDRKRLGRFGMVLEFASSVLELVLGPACFLGAVVGIGALFSEEPTAAARTLWELSEYVGTCGAAAVFGLLFVSDGWKRIRFPFETYDTVEGIVVDRQVRSRRTPAHRRFVISVGNEDFIVGEERHAQAIEVGDRVEIEVGHRSRFVRRLVHRGRGKSELPSPSAALREAFDFLAIDVEINRAGRFTEHQRARLARARSKEARLLGAVVVGHAWLLAAVSASTMFAVGIGALGVLIEGAILAKLVRLTVDLHARTVVSFEGRASAYYVEYRGRQGPRPGNRLRVGDVVFEVTAKERLGASVALRQLGREPSLRAYVSAKGRALVSLEPIAEATGASHDPT